MVNSGDRANVLTKHAGDIAGTIHGNRIKRTDKGLRLWANGHAGTTIYAGIPANIKEYWCTVRHAQIFLYSDSGLK